MQNLQFSGFLFSEELFPVVCGDVVTIVCLVLWTFYLFHLMFLVYLSQRLLAPFFNTCLTLWQLFLGEFSWIVHGILWCVQWHWMTPSYLSCCLVDVQCNMSILFDLPIYLPLHEQANWYTLGWLLSSSFGLFWHWILCKFMSDMKVMSLYTFLKFIHNFWFNIRYTWDFVWVGDCDCDCNLVLVTVTVFFVFFLAL